MKSKNTYFDGWKYKLGKDDPHIPNKNESKLLRKLMSETSMSEDEIRGIKKYRKLLSETSKEGHAYHNIWKNTKQEKLWKRVTKETGLVRNHPVSKYVYNIYISKSYYRSWLVIFHPINLSNKDLEILKKWDLTKYDEL